MSIVLNGTTGITTPDINTTAQSTDIISTGDISAVDATLSGGVYLGGTGSANKLEDYEEGTWTPDVEVGSVVSSTGGYVKVGGLVTVFLQIDGITNDTSTSTFKITGLPFTCNSYNRPTGAVFGERMDVNNVVAACTAGQSTIGLFNGVGSTTFGDIRYNNVNSAADFSIRLSISYYTAS